MKMYGKMFCYSCPSLYRVSKNAKKTTLPHSIYFLNHKKYYLLQLNILDYI